MRKITYPPTLYDVMACQGGWDLETPTLTLPTGFVRDAQNFEVSHVKGGGYARVEGYERFSGQPEPSAASFSIIQFSNLLSNPAIGDTATGGTSGATGVVVQVVEAEEYIVVTKVTGSFSIGETVTASAVNLGTTVTQTVFPTALQTAQYIAAAADEYRSDILAIPGSGPVRGVCVLPVNGVDQVFAFRDNSTATLCRLWKATTSGWDIVPFFHELSFTDGTVAPVEGEDIVQGLNTGTIKRLMVESGSWAAGTATGRIVYEALVGAFAAGAATSTSGGAFVVFGSPGAITLTPGGRYEFDTHNFFGQSETRRLYGCSGVQRGFEFDGTIYAPIAIAGPAADTIFPSHVACHKEHLFFAVDSSIIHSGPGEPYKFNAASGGGEIATGDEITNFLKQPGAAETGALGLTTRSNSCMLYGTSSLDWNFVPLNQGVMGLPYTGGRLNQSYWLDDSGVTSLRATQEWGNFNSAMLTNTITRYITEKKGFVVASGVHKPKSQYRLYFSDGTALYTTLVNGKLFGLMPQVFQHPFYTIWDGPSANGYMFAGGLTSGHVYRLDVGTSFDGEDIDAFLVFNWNPMKSPRVLKRYRSASLEMQGGIYAAVNLGYNLSYGRQGIPQGSFREYTAEGSGVAFWDQFVWDEFYWDGQIISPAEAELRGTGENIQIVITSGTDYIPAYTLNSIILHYTPRRGMH